MNVEEGILSPIDIIDFGEALQNFANRDSLFDIRYFLLNLA
jgi:hypothetical protein